MASGTTHTSRNPCRPSSLSTTRRVFGTISASWEAGSLKNLPVGLDSAMYQWVDLDGESLSGVLTEQAARGSYKRNLSNVPPDSAGSSQDTAARFGPLELAATSPSLAERATKRHLVPVAGKTGIRSTRGCPQAVDVGEPSGAGLRRRHRVGVPGRRLGRWTHGACLHSQPRRCATGRTSAMDDSARRSPWQTRRSALRWSNRRELANVFSAPQPRRNVNALATPFFRVSATVRAYQHLNRQISSVRMLGLRARQ